MPTRMAELKTKPTKASVEKHIAAIAKEEQRNDAQALVALMRRITRQEPRMWGPSIVGFGSYHYKYASGHEGDSALAGFAVRKSEFAIYVVAASMVKRPCWPSSASTGRRRRACTSNACPTWISKCSRS